MSAQAPSIFISYRRSDGDFLASELRRQLVERFGEDAVWHPEHSIRPGEQWRPALTEAVRRCRVVIVVIGPNWLGVTDEHGTRRVDRKTDWVRREIEAAGQAGVPIIPVLAPGAPVLKHAELPASLAALADRQYLRLDPSNVTSAIDTLIGLVWPPAAAQRVDAEEAGSPSQAPELVAAVSESPGHERRSAGRASMRIRREEVPNGPIRDFFDRLHELHRWAGEPSTRSIAKSIGQGVISYGTVYSAFRGPQVPRWGHLELIVEALDGDIDVFRQAWVRAREAEDELRANGEAHNG